jgi:hypothetical protein
MCSILNRNVICEVTMSIKILLVRSCSKFAITVNELAIGLYQLESLEAINKTVNCNTNSFTALCNFECNKLSILKVAHKTRTKLYFLMLIYSNGHIPPPPPPSQVFYISSLLDLNKQSIE